MHFLRAELRTGLTLSRIALTANWPSKKERNCLHARKAYDSILHFLPQAGLSPDETAEVQTKLAELRAELQLLGEKI